MKISNLFGIAAAALVAFAAPAFAGPEVNTTIGLAAIDGKPAGPLAVHGFDVVAYQTEKRAVEGDVSYSTTHEGSTYRFASKANLGLFKANPAKYVPAYGGYCAYGVSVGAKFDGDPRYWKVVDGKLYLNLDRAIQKAFNADVAGAISKADTNWPKLAKLYPSEIK